MQLPEALEAKFTTLLGRYPVKRSALIPMMMYAQDYFGYLSDELLTDIAQRLELNMTQVTETLAYYSMLRRKPVGRYHIQVCTNISCMLRGGTNSTPTCRSAWASAINRSPLPARFRWKKSNVWAPAPALRPCK